MCDKKNSYFIIILLSIVLFFGWGKGNSQEYKIYFENIEPQNIEKGVFEIPHSVKYSVFWNLYKIDDNKVTLVTPELVESENYHFHFKTEKKDTLFIINGRNWLSDNLEAQKGYQFKFDPSTIVLKDGNTITAHPADDGWVKILTGKENRISKTSSVRSSEFSNLKTFLWLVIPTPFDFIFQGKTLTEDDELPQSEGQYSLMFSIKKSYDTSTMFGKIAFGMIDWCLALGFIFILVCHRRLRLSYVFPFYKTQKVGFIQIPLVSVFWDIIYSLKGGIGFGGSYKSRLTEEFNQILANWKALVKTTSLQKNKKVLELSQSDLEKEQKNLWKENGEEKSEELVASLKKINNYPISRILIAGLKNLIINRMFFQQNTSVEVDRAMANRAVAEWESMKQRSFYEWLWNLGALSPMAGLLGTVTGISFAFYKIAGLPGGSEDIVAELAPNINEALYTTILGLIVGIFLMLMFYYFRSKLDWIYNKWEQIYVDVTEDL